MKYVKRLIFLLGAALVAMVALFVNEDKLKKIGASISDTKDAPQDLSKTDWRIALMRTKDALSDKDLPMLAAGLAYFGTLSFFPAVVAIITIYSLAVSKSQLNDTVMQIEKILPKEMATLITSQMNRVAHQHGAGVAAITIAILLALFSASGGVQNLIKATNRAYGVKESRSFIKLRAISLLMLLIGLIFAAPIFALLIASSSTLSQLHIPSFIVTTFPYLRWIIIIILVSLLLALIYRYAPNRDQPTWQIVSWGSTAATVIWLIGTALFFYYVQHLGNFEKSYGVFAGIIALMTWLNLTSFIILVGAEVNHRLEEQID